MLLKIIVGISVPFGLYYLSKATDKFAKLITLILLIGILLVFIPNSVVLTIGYVLFGVATLCCILYSIFRIKDNKRKRIVLFTAIPIFFKFLFDIENWPSGMFTYLMIIPIICYVIVLTRRKEFREELGFLTMLTASALSNIVGLIMVIIE